MKNVNYKISLKTFKSSQRQEQKLRKIRTTTVGPILWSRCVIYVKYGRCISKLQTASTKLSI